MDEQKNNAPAENKPEKKLSRTTLTFYIVGLFSVAIALILISYVAQARADRQVENLSSQLNEQQTVAQGATQKVADLQQQFDLQSSALESVRSTLGTEQAKTDVVGATQNLRDREDRAGMAAGELSPADHRADFLGKLQKAKCVCDRRARLDDALRDLLLRQTVVAHELLVAFGFLNRVEVLPLQILDERKLHDLALARFNDHRRNLVEAGLPGRAPSSLARDNLICAVFFTRAHRNRCDDAVQADAFRQLVKRLLREYLPRLIGVWFDAADRDFADAVRRGFGVQVSDRVIPEQVGQTAAQSQTFSA